MSLRLNQILGGADIRSPIFYDSNDTGYYLDPASTSRLNTINVGASGVIINNASTAAERNLKIKATGSNPGVGIALYDSSDNFRVQLYGEASNYGFLDGLWAAWDLRKTIDGNLYLNDSTTYYLNTVSTSALYDLTLIGAKHTYLYINPGNGYEAMVRYNGGSGSGWYVGKRITSQLVGTESFHFYSEAAGATVGGIDTSGNIFSTGSVRSPIFYDSNDTTYYIDPANGGFNLRGGNSNRVTFNSGDSGIIVTNAEGVSSNVRLGCAWNRPGIYNGSSITVGAETQIDFVIANAVKAYIDSSSNLFSNGSVRSPIFYDSNNTAFYTDPASTSVLNRLTIDGGNYANNYFQSLSDFVNGTLVTTDIPATAANGLSFVMNVIGKSYNTTTSPFNFSVQGYLYDNTIINFSGLRLDSSGLSTIKIFENGGFLCFWWARVSYWNAFEVSVRSYDTAKTNYNRVTNITDVVEPTGTKKVTVTLQTFMRADVSATNAVDLRSQIFYDTNNTAFYCDPTGTSNFTGLTVANTITGSVSGNAGTATILQTARNINGTSFNGSAAITTATWGTARTITIGSTGKSVDGSANVSWSLAELGAAATNQTMFIGTTSVAINRASASQTLTGISIDGSSASCTGNSATTTLATKATRANGDFFIDDNYGNTVVGLYSATRLQGVFAMGNSYKLTADGTGVGTLYGLAWSHPNFGGVAANLADHGLLILQNGVFKGAWGGGSLRTPGDVRGTLFYDWDNTAYYCDPASTSNLNAITAAGNITAAQYYTGGWFRNSTNGNGLYNESTTQHFYSDSTNYWNVASSASAQGIRLRTGGHAGTVRGYFYADTANDVGLLNQDGNWRVRVVGGDYTLFSGSSIRAPLFYDSNDTAYYCDPAGTSYLDYSIFNGLSSADYTRQFAPGGGYFYEGGAVTGAIKIRLPANSKTLFPMLSFTCHIYNYSTGTSRTFKIGGHFSSSSWFNPFAYCLSESGGNLNVRWGFEGNFLCVWIGETNTGWSYPNVFITDFQNGYSSINNSWMKGWVVSRVTAFDTVTNGPTAAGFFWNQNNDGSGSGLDADLVDGLEVHTGRNDNANKIVRTDSNGYIQAGWINTTSGNEGTTAIDRVYASYDGYIRYYTPANFRTVLDVPTRAGSGANGSWAISVTGSSASCTGNAATVTNGVYTNTGNTLTGTNLFQSNLGTTSGSLSGPALQAYATGTNAAFMSFHRGGSYAVNMGLDSDNVLRIGGWSAAANRWELDMSGNNWVASSFRAPIFYDSNNTTYYVDPASTSNLVGLTVANTITGSVSGSSGSCTGNSATATTATSSGCVNSDTGNVGGSRLQYWQVSGNTTLNPDTEWYNAIRMGHGDPVTYYSNTLAVKMTGSNLGDIYTRTTTNGTAGTWNRFWNNNNDGAGSGLDADLLDGINSASFLRSDASATNSVDLRSPIFYDSNNTAYYIDAASTSNLVGLTVANTITGSITGNAGGSSASCSGNAATATVLQTARTIGGVSFNGSANINLPGVNTAGNQNTTGTSSNITAYTINQNVGTANTPKFLNVYGERVALNSASPQTINTQYNVTELTLTSSISTLTFSNIQASGIVHMWTLVTVGNATVYTITWPAAVKWPGGTAPTLTTTSGKRDIYQFVTYDGGTNIYAIIVGQNL